VINIPFLFRHYLALKQFEVQAFNSSSNLRFPNNFLQKCQKCKDFRSLPCASTDNDRFSLSDSECKDKDDYYEKHREPESTEDHGVIPFPQANLSLFIFRVIFRYCSWNKMTFTWSHLFLLQRCINILRFSYFYPFIRNFTHYTGVGIISSFNPHTSLCLPSFNIISLLYPRLLSTLFIHFVKHTLVLFIVPRNLAGK